MSVYLKNSVHQLFFFLLYSLVMGSVLTTFKNASFELCRFYAGESVKLKSISVNVFNANEPCLAKVGINLKWSFPCAWPAANSVHVASCYVESKQNLTNFGYQHNPRSKQ